MKLTDKEIETVIQLDSEKRFEYAIKRIADNESLYSAKFPDGDYAIIPSNNTYLFPVWSACQYCERCIDVSTMQCVEISLAQFVNEIIDLISSNGWELAVFPLSNGDYGRITTINKFCESLKSALEDYE
jgi:hypothetical protein